MKYLVPATFYLYSILVGGERFEDICEAQILMAEHGLSLSETDALSDIEREIFTGILVKKEKDKIEGEKAKFEAYAKLLTR